MSGIIKREGSRNVEPGDVTLPPREFNALVRRAFGPNSKNRHLIVTGIKPDAILKYDKKTGLESIPYITGKNSHIVRQAADRAIQNKKQ